MRAQQSNARIIVLAAAVFGLGAWHLVGMRTARDPSLQEVDAAGPLPSPEMVEGQQMAPGGLRSDPLVAGDQEGWMQPAVSGGSPPAWIAPGTAAQDQLHDPQPGGQGLLDNVFAPDRFVQAPQARPDGSLLPDEVVVGRNKPVSAAFAVPGAPGASTAESGKEPEKPRQANEKTYYDEYLALAKEDATALGLQVAAVLTPGGETARQVALLRVLYGTDRAQALDHFAKAMASLPDVSKPSGVSVPVFAAGFLARQSNDPAAVRLAERIAWGGHLNVSQEVRNAAANALLSRATPDDLQRYAAYPGFKPPMPESTEP